MSEIVAEAKTLYVYMTCDKCGYEQVYSEVYPCKKLVPIEEPRKPTDEEMKWIRSD